MERYIKHIISSADKRIDLFLKEQVKNPADPFYGGLRGDILDVKPTVYMLTTAAAVYLNEESKYYMEERLYEAIELSLSFIRRLQREDGSFDYPSCNFKSAPDTAFCFKRLISAYRLLKTRHEDEGCKKLAEKYLVIMKDSLNGIKNGGFHTPNHRWAIAAALMQGAGLFHDEPFAKECRERAEQYLAEGIDGNEDGEYAERSTGNYNAVVNNAMISLYEETGNEAYLGYAQRNLHMMLTYIDPDDTIFTQNSTRQDKGKAVRADIYFYQYLYMAVIAGRQADSKAVLDNNLHGISSEMPSAADILEEICTDGYQASIKKASITKNTEFDAAAHKIIKDNMDRGDLAPDCLHVLMLHEDMLKHSFKNYGFLESYRIFYKESGIIRVKRNKYAYSVVNKNPAFFFMKVNQTQIIVKIGESYCDIRNFVPKKMEVLPDGCRLNAEAEGWYYLPFNDKQDTSDWWQMDHKKREILNSSRLETEVILIEKPDGILFRVKAGGIDRLPLRVEISVPDNAVLENDHFHLITQEGQSMVLKSDCAVLTDQNNKIKIGPGYGSHSFKRHYSEEGKQSYSYTIYLNEYTPCDMEFSIEVL